MIRDAGDICRLGVAPESAALRFGEGPKQPGAAWGPRRLFAYGRSAFELGLWCGTCPFLFERQEGSRETFSLNEFAAKLAQGVDEIDSQIAHGYGSLLEQGDYLPMLLRVEPTLTYPCGENDYFSHEQVDTWGIDAFWGLPENPRTPYYRTFSAPVTSEAHLYEFVVPMVPPNWNDRTRVLEYQRFLANGTVPAAVAISILDVVAPAVDDESVDYHTHWCLTHFLLDGHHKMEAAALTGSSIDVLTLVALDFGLSSQSDRLDLLRLRAQDPAVRTQAD